ncbi:MAG: YdcF family protein [Blastocatellia bacterium]|nr:YdcF family protein [Blastocatellia bacterium]
MAEAKELKPKATRWRRWIFVVTALLLLYFLLPVALNWLAACLVREDPLRPADVVIAMGGGRHCLRLHYAAELYRQGLGRKLLLSGIESFEGGDAEENVRQQAVSSGVPAGDIFILTNTFNTRTEADLLTELMQQHGWKSALVVSEPSHTRRAHYTLQQSAPEFQFTAHPVPADRPGVWRAERWWTRHSDTRYTIREFLAWGNTLAGGLR